MRQANWLYLAGLIALLCVNISTQEPQKKEGEIKQEIYKIISKFTSVRPYGAHCSEIAEINQKV